MQRVFFLHRIFSTTCGRALQAEKMQKWYIIHKVKNGTYDILYIFIDLEELCCITNLSKVGAENWKYPSSARKQSLTRFNTLHATLLIISSLYDSAKSLTHSIRESIVSGFENKPLFGQQPKSESQAGWDQDCALARWYQFQGLMTRQCNLSSRNCLAAVVHWGGAPSCIHHNLRLVAADLNLGQMLPRSRMR